MIDFQEIEAAGGHVKITDIPQEEITITITKMEKSCLAECDYFENWSCGKTYWEALRNLMARLEDYYKILKTENLGGVLARIQELLGPAADTKPMPDVTAPLEKFEKGGSS